MVEQMNSSQRTCALGKNYPEDVGCTITIHPHASLITFFNLCRLLYGHMNCLILFNCIKFNYLFFLLINYSLFHNMLLRTIDQYDILLIELVVYDLH